METTIDFYKNLLDNLYDGVYFVDPKRRISYWNRGAERITGYTEDEVVGSHCWDGILMHVDREGTDLCREGCPVKGVITSGTPTEAEVFLRHKDGHRVPVRVRATPIVNVAGEIIGAVEIFSDNTEKMTALQMVEDLQQQVFIDSLTGLANRRYADITLQARYDEMQRYGWRFGVIMMDLDHFKEINDRFGHGVGDDVLKMVARTLRHSSRSSDIIGRWGGEEFIAVIAGTSPLRLRRSAERYRLLVEQSTLRVGADALLITLSAGATVAVPGESLDDILKRADRLLYESKGTGRNRVTLD